MSTGLLSKGGSGMNGDWWACASGISGVVSQGKDWKTTRVAAFYLAKLNSTQQNYPVHEIELMAGIEMVCHTDILQGIKFKWVMDHKGLTHLLNQKNLSGQQARWLKKISSFDFEVMYVPGTENMLANALSWMYAVNLPGTVRAKSEYTYLDIANNMSTLSEPSCKQVPMLAGSEAQVMSSA
jgi:RNase H-like domain found in reverse transcriptase